MRFSLPSTRYFRRQRLPPLGATSRYMPRPSASLYDFFAPGLAFRIVRSVRRSTSAMGATLWVGTSCAAYVAPGFNRRLSAHSGTWAGDLQRENWTSRGTYWNLREVGLADGVGFEPTNGLPRCRFS